MNQVKRLMTGLLFCAMPLAAAAQSENPAWIETLNFEMEKNHECEVAYYLHIKEGELGGKTTYEARLQCVDGRQFDASRIGEEGEFTAKLCEVQTC